MFLPPLPSVPLLPECHGQVGTVLTDSSGMAGFIALAGPLPPYQSGPLSEAKVLANRAAEGVGRQGWEGSDQ